MKNAPFFIQERIFAFLYLFDFLDLHYVVGRGLIYEIIKPICEKEGGVTSPGAHGSLGVVVIREVIFGYLWINSRRLATGIFLIQGVGIVLRVTRKEHLSSPLGLDGVNARLVGGCENFQSLTSSISSRLTVV